MTTETIAAIASGLTHAGIGIIRISGPDALQVGDRVATGTFQTQRVRQPDLNNQASGKRGYQHHNKYLK